MRLFFVLLSTAVAATASGKLISKVVGRAGDYFFTSREVQINYVLEQALVLPPEKFAKAPLNLPVEDKNFRLELNGVFLEWVVAQEAQAFAVAKIDDREFQQAVEMIGQRLAAKRYWKDLKVDDDELKTFLMRKLRAKKFIQFKAESSVIEITESEALDYYQKNQGRFGDVPFSSFSEKIRTFLKQKKRDERLQAWFDVLQNKYEVRTYLTEKK